MNFEEAIQHMKDGYGIALYADYRKESNILQGPFFIDEDGQIVDKNGTPESIITDSQNIYANTWRTVSKPPLWRIASNTFRDKLKQKTPYYVENNEIFEPIFDDQDIWIPVVSQIINEYIIVKPKNAGDNKNEISKSN